MIDGFAETGWFADDFTLAEIKTLRAKQRLSFRPVQFDGLFDVPTFEEVLRLVHRAQQDTGRVIGVYPGNEASDLSPAAPSCAGRSVGAPAGSLTGRVFIQSFEVANLKKLSRMTKVRLVQLIDAWDVNADGSINSDPALQFNRPYDFVVSGDPRGYKDLLTPTGLAEVATYADGIGPWKRYIISGAMADLNGNGEADDDVNGDGQVNDADRARTERTSLIEDAHHAGLVVHTWTFRNEARYLLGDYGDDPVQEYFDFYCAGVDGLFSDFPDTAVTARTLFANATGTSLQVMELTAIANNTPARSFYASTYSCSSAIAVASAAMASDSIVQLSGWAEIPHTYRHPGPVSGQFTTANNGIVPPYQGQPIPGLLRHDPVPGTGTFHRIA